MHRSPHANAADSCNNRFAWGKNMHKVFIMVGPLLLAGDPRTARSSSLPNTPQATDFSLPLSITYNNQPDAGIIVPMHAAISGDH